MDHHPTSIQISPDQLQNELESIRSFRRTSLSQPSSDLDPDLPSSLQIDNSSCHSHSSSFLLNHHQSSAIPSHPESSPDDSTPHEQPHPDLFWLPARLHPEIAPQEFKAFIEEATKPENLQRRTSFALGSRRNNSNDPNNSTGVNRRKSMLSNVYHPSDHDLHNLPSKPHSDPSILRVVSMSSPNHRGRGAQGLENLTINDLQRLEAMVLKEPSSHHQNSPSDPILGSNLHSLNLNDHRINSIISRSLSIGSNPTASLNDSEINFDQIDSEAIDDSPLISRPPGHIIRRTARTKVRKPLLPGDGNGHRFTATRRTPIKNSTLTNSPGPASVASNASEETLTNDLSPSRHSSQEIQDSHSSLPIQLTSSGDPLAPRISIDEDKLSSDSKLASQRPHSNPSPVSKSSQTSLLDGSHHHHHLPLSEDDQSISSASRPDSVISNSSLLDAYAYDIASSDDPSSTHNLSHFDLSESSTPISKTDLVAQMPLKSSQSSSADHQQLANDSDVAQKQISHSTALPPLVNHQLLPYASSSKPDALKSVNNSLNDPLSARTSLSSDELLSTSTRSAIASDSTATSASAVNSNSSCSPLTPISSQNPLGTLSSRPTPGATKTSPNSKTPASVDNVTPSVPPPAGTKEGKEKKRTWVKLGLASAVSPSSKGKKEKGKDKQKAKVDSPQTNVGPSGQSHLPVAPQSSSIHNVPTGAIKKESGFLSGLFGSKSKKQDTELEKQSSLPNQLTGNTKSSQNNFAFGGSSLSSEMQAQQQLINPTASGGFIHGRFMSFYRLPIHVERAVYRLSHIKLANPRRPLYEQVLISNLMFWYLGVINKAQSAPPVNKQVQVSHTMPTSSSPGVTSSSHHQQNPANLTTGNDKVSQNNRTKSQNRGPGIKKNWKKTRGKEAFPSNVTASGSSGSSIATTINQEWIEPDSSESSESGQEEEQSGKATRKIASKGNKDRARSASSSSSSTTTGSSDDEKPLGSRIALSKKNQISLTPASSSKIIPNPHPIDSSKNKNRNSDKSNSRQNRGDSRRDANNSDLIKKDRDVEKSNSRINPALVVKPRN